MNSKLRLSCLFVNYCFGRWSPNVNDGAFKGDVPLAVEG